MEHCTVMHQFFIDTMWVRVIVARETNIRSDCSAFSLRWFVSCSEMNFNRDWHWMHLSFNWNFNRYCNFHCIWQHELAPKYERIRVKMVQKFQQLMHFSVCIWQHEFRQFDATKKNIIVHTCFMGLPVRFGGIWTSAHGYLNGVQWIFESETLPIIILMIWYGHDINGLLAWASEFLLISDSGYGVR